MEGWDFLARIKELPDLRHTPVVVISIVADSARGLSLGAAAVIQKPIPRQALLDSLTRLGMLRPESDTLVSVVHEGPAHLA